MCWNWKIEGDVDGDVGDDGRVRVEAELSGLAGAVER
jgi:hypothetical protein